MASSPTARLTSQLDPSSPSRESRKSRAASRDIDSASSSLSPVAPATPAATGMDIDMKNDDDDSSSDEHQPKPAPTIPHHQTFGDDPSTFPDPTIYEILPVTDDMTDEEKKKIYSVEVFPHDNLEELIPGIPPDKDFSIAKPTNQVQANTFATYIEPYFRDFNEEDLAFLRERGDRVQCMVIPKRGKRHYTEVWLEEDGALSIDTPQQGRDKLSPNQARGNIDAMDDASAETDSVSVGPLLSRLLSTMKPERRAAPEEKSSTNGLTNGELNGDTNGDFDASQPPDGPAPVPPASYMADSNSDAWKKATHHKLDHLQVEQRLKQELRHIGFLAQDAEPDYDAHFDDDIAARLRLLQLKLKEAIVQNGARKARLMELAKERLAYQEWKTILEDLDNQVCAAYAKRTRTMGKSKKTKRPGGAGGGSHYVGGAGMAKPGIGDNIKVLLDRRKKWIKLGQVFDSEFKVPRFKNKSGEDTSIFKPQDMGELMRKERESWDDDGEDE
jgi:transcriptional adapter 3